MPTILHIVGARPNFVKMAPLVRALEGRDGLTNLLAHTGQHYDSRMSDEVIGDLGLPEPDFFLGVGSGRHGAQTARALSAVEDLLVQVEPDLLVVAGDVNSTLAAALAASKLHIDIAHLESGLRSFDWEMPEEVNRVLTDRLSDLLLTHSPEAEPNLLAEGIPAERIHLVGNTMIDSLRRFEGAAAERAAWQRVGVPEGGYVLVTLHRPSNVDVPEKLSAIVSALIELASRHPVVFPVHPRTRARLEADGSWDDLVASGTRCLDPVGYLDFLSLEIGAGAVLTDSGGIQEETASLGVPCFTLRANTERPVTVTHGSNTMLGDDPASIARVTLDGGGRRDCAIPYWDGHAGERAADVICTHLQRRVREEAETRGT